METAKSRIGLYKRLPSHVGIIPDGNRRWAEKQGMAKKDGYAFGVNPGFELYELCLELGIKEMTFYGFTQDNTKRPAEQRKEFQRACVRAVDMLAAKDAELLVVGNTNSRLFPKDLLPFTKRIVFGKGLMRVNFLVNYGWQWDLASAISILSGKEAKNKAGLAETIASREISRLDLIVRWGGRRRLSGFLPVQSIYADFYVVDEMWPDFRPKHLFEALSWYDEQDVTLGG